jgi:hypothetical protein
MKSTFQRIKQQGNRKFLQADMAKSPKVARAEILDSYSADVKQLQLPHSDSD